MLTATAAHARLFNPYHPDFQSNPYPTYDLLRTQDSIFRSFMGVWVVSRYQDVEQVLRHPHLGSDLQTWDGYQQRFGPHPAIRWLLSHWIVNRDPPIHTSLRRLFAQSFAPGCFKELPQEVTRIVHRLLDRISETKGIFDVIASLAYPLPLNVILYLFGIPEKDWRKVKAWSVDVSYLIEPLPSRPKLHQIEQSVLDFSAYLREKLDRYRRDPEDNFLSRVLHHTDPTLNDDHILSSCIFYLSAGHETTVNLIGNGVFTLLNHPNQAAELRANPHVMASAIEEMLRYESPLQIAWRTALDDVVLNGQLIAQGEQVMVLLGAANRDPARFAEPDQFDMYRKIKSHLAFGVGTHTCLGGWLTRLEGKIAISALLARFPALRLHTLRPTWRSTTSQRGLESLWVAF